MHLETVTVRPDRFPTDQHYPFNLEILRQAPQLTLKSPITFFVGENGAGKSTFLQAICRRCGIHIWKPVERRRAQPNPYEKYLHRALDITWTDGPVPGSLFSSQNFHHFAELLDEWEAAAPGAFDYLGGKSLVAQSHGQSLMSFFKSRYRIKGIYFVDEPETALSPRTQIELLRFLAEISREGHAQFIIATHSPILLACPEATIYSLDHVPIREIAYEDTDHYRVYKAFMEAPRGKR